MRTLHSIMPHFCLFKAYSQEIGEIKSFSRCRCVQGRCRQQRQKIPLLPTVCKCMCSFPACEAGNVSSQEWHMYIQAGSRQQGRGRREVSEAGAGRGREGREKRWWWWWDQEEKVRQAGSSAEKRNPRETVQAEESAVQEGCRKVTGQAPLLGEASSPFFLRGCEAAAALSDIICMYESNSCTPAAVRRPQPKLLPLT